MGFGSYDESEQQNQELNTDDDTKGVNVHENDPRANSPLNLKLQSMTSSTNSKRSNRPLTPHSIISHPLYSIYYILTKITIRNWAVNSLREINIFIKLFE